MRIVVLVGLPGSGKSTYLERLGVSGLSSDAIRRLLADDETDQTINHRVFQTLRYLLRQRIAAGRPVTYIDATNLTPEERRPYVQIGRRCGCEVVLSSSMFPWMSAWPATRNGRESSRRKLC